MIVLFCNEKRMIKELRFDLCNSFSFTSQQYYITFDIENHQLYVNDHLILFVYKKDRIQFQLDNEAYIIYLLFDDNQYDCFIPYQIKDNLVISKLADSDVRYQYPLYYTNDLIESDEWYFVDGYNQNLWHTHQVLQVGFLKIIRGYDFWMINQVGDVQLEEYLPTFSISCLSIPVEHHSIYFDEIKPLFIELKNPATRVMNTQVSLLNVIGPTMTMSLASLSVGLIQFNENYTPDKSLLSQSTMIIFPIVMMTSLIFWQPLFKWINKRNFKKKNQLRNEKYLKYLDEVEKHINNYKDKINQHTLHKANFNFKPFYGYTIKKKHWDYLSVVVGYSEVSLDFNLKYPPLLEEEDPLYEEITALINQYKVQEKGYLTLNLSAYKRVWIKNNVYIDFMIIAQLFYHHDPSLKIVIYDPFAHYEYLSLLPHVFDKELLYYQQEYLLIQADDRFNENSLFICFDREIHLKTPFVCSLYFLEEKTAEYDLEIIYDRGQGELKYKNQQVKFDIIKKLDLFILVKSLRGTDYVNSSKSYKRSFLDMKYEVPEKNTQHLIAGIGFDQYHQVIQVNLHENCDGPHGLIVGTTGSGKSELLITMLLSLIMNYQASEVQFVLIDFKGTNLFHQFKTFPHIINHLSNLDDQMVDRALYGLNQECVNRQRKIDTLSRLSGKIIRNIDDYNILAKDNGVEPLAHLVIVTDEFAQLKLLNPVMIDELIAISRIGRSLGFHLILTTQRTQGVVDQQLLSNIHFKICLKVNEIYESMDVLNTADAYHLKEIGGFILSCHHRYIQGIGGYTKDYYFDYEKDHECLLYDLNAHQKVSLFKQPTNPISQIEYLATNYSNNNRYPSLWVSSIESVSIDLLIEKYSNLFDKTTIFIGEIDDYKAGKQSLSYLDFTQHVYMIFYRTQESYFKLIHLLVFHCIKFQFKMVIITLYPEYYKSIDRWINVVSFNDMSMLEYMINQSLEDTIIFVDEDGILEKMISFIQAVKQKILFKQGLWIFNTTKSHCPYYLKFIQEKISIEQSKDQVFSSIQQEISFNLKPNQAYDKKLICLSLTKMSKKNIKKYRIPKCALFQMSRDKVILGYDVKNLQIVKISLFTHLEIYGTKKVIIDNFIKLGLHVLTFQVQLNLDLNVDFLIILSLSEQDKYRLNIAYELSENEMLLVEKNVVRKIKYEQENSHPPYITL